MRSDAELPVWLPGIQISHRPSSVWQSAACEGDAMPFSRADGRVSIFLRPRLRSLASTTKPLENNSASPRLSASVTRQPNTPTPPRGGGRSVAITFPSSPIWGRKNKEDKLWPDSFFCHPVVSCCVSLPLASPSLRRSAHYYARSSPGKTSSPSPHFTAFHRFPFLGWRDGSRARPLPPTCPHG